MKVYSIGYERWDLDAFCDALVKQGVKVLVDVRQRAWSQRPEYRKTRLSHALRERGVRYVHCKEAGNPHRPRKGEKKTVAACEAAYRAHLEAHPEVVGRVEQLVAEAPSALFCYERHRSCCHRGVLLSALAAKREDVEVIDI